MHITSLEEVLMKHMAIICILIGSIVRERWTRISGAWIVGLCFSCSGTSINSKTCPVLHLWSPVSTTSRCRSFPAQERESLRYTAWNTLWFYLCVHREDMMKCDRKPTLVLAAWVHEPWGKAITIQDSFRKRKHLQLPEENSPNRVEGMFWLLILLKELPQEVSDSDQD